MAGTPTNAASVAWLLRRRGSQPVEIWGLTPEERLRRTLRAAGCAQVESVEADGALPAAGPESLLLLRSDFVFDERLVLALRAEPGTLLVTPDGVAVAAHVDASRAAEIAARLAQGAAASATGLRAATPSELVPAYTAQLRKVEPAYLFEARPSSRAIEERTFSASYKGVTDLVTKWVWPARRHVTPARGLACIPMRHDRELGLAASPAGSSRAATSPSGCSPPG
jgi:hypothetical protein